MTGAITSHKQAFYYVQRQGTTLQNVIDVIDQVPLPNPRRTVLVMDNHNVHRTQDLRDYVNKKGISILMLPPSSSSLNPVGKLFSSNGVNIINLFFF
jgi:transposase